MSVTAKSSSPTTLEDAPTHSPVMEQVISPVDAAEIALSSGRRYELEAGATSDRVTIRGRGGDAILEIEVTAAGPVLRFSCAELHLETEGRLALAAGEISLRAERGIRIEAGGSLEERIGGEHHSRVEGATRLEAANVEIQADVGAIELLAMRSIHVDGEAVELNGKPEPAPFSWSRAALDEAES